MNTARSCMTGTKDSFQTRERLNHVLEQSKKLSLHIAGEARAAHNLKSSFLATVNHEIRTPMNGIIGMTELLITTGLSLEQQEYADCIQECTFSLLSVIEDILSYSMLEAGTLSLEDRMFSIRLVIQEAVHKWFPRAEEKGLWCAYTVKEDVPVSFRGDAGRLAVILDRVLDNAVRFTGQGGITLAVSMADDSMDGRAVQFIVSDTGPGIPESQRETIFKPFTQVDNSLTRTHEGLGLGLPIARKLVELMGGKISLESNGKSGTVVRFTIPPGKLPATMGSRSPGVGGF